MIFKLIDWYGEYLFKGFNTDNPWIVTFNLMGGFVVTGTTFNAVKIIIGVI